MIYRSTGLLNVNTGERRAKILRKKWHQNTGRAQVAVLSGRAVASDAMTAIQQRDAELQHCLPGSFS